jgi:hypothetical protein
MGDRLYAETNSCERRINKGFEAVEALHIVAQPNLNHLMLRDRRSNSIKYFAKSREANPLQILAWTKRLFKSLG